MTDWKKMAVRLCILILIALCIISFCAADAEAAKRKKIHHENEVPPVSGNSTNSTGAAREQPGFDFPLSLVSMSGLVLLLTRFRALPRR